VALPIFWGGILTRRHRIDVPFAPQVPGKCGGRPLDSGPFMTILNLQPPVISVRADR
jgi:hypothetical protein